MKNIPVAITMTPGPPLVNTMMKGMNTMVNQHVICPCGKEIPFDAWDDVFDTSVDTLGGEYIEYTCYTCLDCGKEFTAKIHYTVKFNKISY